jgi:hypothetical protein
LLAKATSPPLPESKPQSDMETCAGKYFWDIPACGLRIEMELFYVYFEHLN